MGKTCETCGNTYDKAFEVVMGGTTHTFDRSRSGFTIGTQKFR